MAPRRRAAALAAAALALALAVQLLLFGGTGARAQQCSGDVTLSTSPTGQLSDGPGTYSPNMQCSWYVPPELQTLGLNLTFSEFNIDHSDFILVTFLDSRPTKYLTGSPIPYRPASFAPPVYAITWYTDPQYESDGFTLTYLFDASITHDDGDYIDGFVNEAGDGGSGGGGGGGGGGGSSSGDTGQDGTGPQCSGVYTVLTPSSTLSDGAGSYTDNQVCHWDFTSVAHTSYEIGFLYFLLEQGYDYIRVYESSGTQYEFTGYFLPANLSGTGLSYIEFSSDFSVTYGGFNIEVTLSNVTNVGFSQSGVCSGTKVVGGLPASVGDGTAASAPYRANSACRWSFLQSAATPTLLYFVRLDIESPCFSDCVYINSYANYSAQYTITGQSLPAPLRLGVSDYPFDVSFYSNSVTEYTGFHMRLRDLANNPIQTLPSGQSTFTVNATNAEFYKVNMSELVTRTRPLLIQLSYVVDPYYVADPDSIDAVVSYTDFASVSTGDVRLVNDTAQSNATFWVLAANISASSITDRNKLVYLTVTNHRATPCVDVELLVNELDTGACSGDVVLDADSGSFHSNRPGTLYAARSNCTFTLSRQQLVQVDVLQFALESGSGCTKDCVQITDANSTVITSLGGNDAVPSSFALMGPITVRFVSDASTQSTGFVFNYTYSDATVVQSGDVLTIAESLSSPTLFAMEVPLVVLGLQFVATANTSFRFEASFNTQVVPSDGGLLHTSNSSNMIESMSPLPTPGFVFFHLAATADSSDDISATLVPVVRLPNPCSGIEILEGTQGRFEDGSASLNYVANQDCQFQLSLPAPSTVVLYFSDFNIEFSSNCEFDCVRVYSSASAAATELGRFSGAALPDPILLTNALSPRVTFTSDSLVNGPGFSGGYQVGLPLVTTASAPAELSLPAATRGYWSFEVDSSTLVPQLQLQMLSLQRNSSFDAYVRRGALPSPVAYDAKLSFSPAATTATLTWPLGGEWYVTVLTPRADTISLAIRTLNNTRDVPTLDGATIRVNAELATNASLVGLVGAYSSRPHLEVFDKCVSQNSMSFTIVYSDFTNATSTSFSYAGSRLLVAPMHSASGAEAKYVLVRATSSRTTVQLCVVRAATVDVSRLDARGFELTASSAELFFPLPLMNVTSPMLVGSDNVTAGAVGVFRWSSNGTTFTDVLQLASNGGTASEFVLPGPSTIAPHIVALFAIDIRSSRADGNVTLRLGAGSELNVSLSASATLTDASALTGAINSLTVMRVDAPSTGGPIGLHASMFNLSTCRCNDAFLAWEAADVTAPWRRTPTTTVAFDWVPSQGCVALLHLRPAEDLFGSNTRVFFTAMSRGPSTCTFAVRAQQLDVLTLSDAGTTTRYVPSGLFDVFLVSATDSFFVETSSTTAVSHLYQYGFSSNTLFSTPFSVTAARASYSSVRNQLTTLLAPGSAAKYAVGVFGFGTTSYSLTFGSLNVEVLPLQLTTTLSVADGTTRFFRWRLGAAFPSVGVEYTTVPRVTITVTSSARALLVAFRAGRDWWTDVPVFSGETMSFTLGQEDLLQIVYPFVDGSRTASVNVKVDQLAALDFDEASSVVVRQNSFAVGGWLWQYTSETSAPDIAVEVTLNASLVCDATGGQSLRIASVAPSPLPTKNFTFNCASNGNTYRPLKMLMASVEAFRQTASTVGARANSSLLRLATVVDTRVEVIGATGLSTVDCPVCAVLIGATIAATQRPMQRITPDVLTTFTAPVGDSALFVVTVANGVSVQARGSSTTQFFLRRDIMPQTFDGAGSDATGTASLTYRDCSPTTRSFYLVAACPSSATAPCAGSVVVLTRTIVTAAAFATTMETAVARLSPPRVAALSGGDFFAVLLDARAFPLGNVQVYSEQYARIGVAYGRSAAVSEAMVITGNPSWAADPADPKRIVMQLPTASSPDTVYEGCAADVGSLVAADSDSLSVATVLSPSQLLFLQRANSSLYERLVVDVSTLPGIGQQPLISRIQLDSLVCTALVVATRNQQSELQVVVFRRNSTLSSAWFFNNTVLAATNVDSASVSAFAMDVRNSIVAVALPKLKLVRVFDLYNGSQIAELTDSSSLGFAADVSISPDGAQIIVLSSVQAVAFSLKSVLAVRARGLLRATASITPDWRFPDAMQTGGVAANRPSSVLGFGIVSNGSSATGVMLKSSTSAERDSALSLFQQTPSGQAWNAATLSAISCPRGTFKNSSSLLSCDLCPRGQYQDSIGSVECIACAAGRHCPSGSVYPMVPSGSVGIVWNDQFPTDNLGDGADSLAMQQLFFDSTNVYFFVTYTFTGLLLLLGLALFGDSKLRKREPRLMHLIAKVDKEKEPELHDGDIKMRGSMVGGLMTIWVSGLILLGVVFVAIFSNTFDVCQANSVPAFSTIAFNPYTASNSTYDTPPTSCIDQNARNIGRKSELKPFSALSAEQTVRLAYMELGHTMNISFDAVGFSDWQTPARTCESVCSDGLVTVSSSGCEVSGQSCSQTTSVRCATVDTYTCRISLLLPNDRVLNSASEFAITLPSYIHMNAARFFVYTPTAQVTDLGDAFFVAGSFARAFASPGATSTQLLRGNVTLGLAYTLGLRETQDLSSNVIGRRAFIEYIEDSLSVPLADASTVLFSDSSTTLTVSLQRSQFWISQSEAPLSSNVGIAFAFLLTMMLLFDLTEIFKRLVDEFRQCYARAQSKRRKRHRGSNASAASSVPHGWDEMGRKSPHSYLDAEYAVSMPLPSPSPPPLDFSPNLSPAGVIVPRSLSLVNADDGSEASPRDQAPTLSSEVVDYIHRTAAAVDDTPSVHVPTESRPRAGSL